jgi:hypothetical protein
VLPVSILNFCSEESLRVIRGGAGCGTDFQLRGESNLADIYSMCEVRKTIHSEQRGLPIKSEYDRAEVV